MYINFGIIPETITDQVKRSKFSTLAGLLYAKLHIFNMGENLQVGLPMTVRMAVWGLRSVSIGTTYLCRFEDTICWANVKYDQCPKLCPGIFSYTAQKAYINPFSIS